jgi:hypothetical protein
MLAFHIRRVIRPIRPQWPGTNLSIIPNILTLGNGRVERSGRHALFNLVYEQSEVCLRKWPVGLKWIGCTVRGSQNEKRTVPIAESFGTFVGRTNLGTLSAVLTPDIA